MTVHRVGRTYRQALDVPVPDQGLPCRRLGEPAVDPHRLDEPRELGRGGDVGAHDAAGMVEHPQRVDRADLVARSRELTDGVVLQQG